MTRASLGEHSKIAAHLIHLGPSFYIGVNYDAAALSDSGGQKAIWLELRADDPEALREKILKFGIKGIEFRDKDHFYFQAPGGQVFRIAGASEDMSSWERSGPRVFAADRRTNVS